MSRSRLDSVVLGLEDEMIRIRREIHAHPELGFEEHETAKLILEVLQTVPGLRIDFPVAQTGVVAVMENGEGPCIAFRADMDALPIDEITDLPFKSKCRGKMHACGHDGHVAILLGAVKALHQLRDEWSGTIKFIFQPGEEGFAGAKAMIADGALLNPEPSSIFGLHLSTALPTGQVGILPGTVMANADVFSVELQGKGGHASRPHETVDLNYVASMLIGALTGIVGRDANALDPAVISVGSIESNGRMNVLPSRVKLTGGVRTYSNAGKKRIGERMCRVCEGFAHAFETKIDLKYDALYPAVVNDEASSRTVWTVAERLLGKDSLMRHRSMGSEDMSFFLEKVPGCFFFLGAWDPAGTAEKTSHHTPDFDFDEKAMVIGAGVYIELARRLLGKNRLYRRESD